MLGIKAHLVDALDEIGGQCTALYPEKPIYDIPGFPKIDAGALIANLEDQADPFHYRYEYANLGGKYGSCYFKITARADQDGDGIFSNISMACALDRRGADCTEVLRENELE